jgi:hypothetical protein
VATKSPKQRERVANRRKTRMSLMRKTTGMRVVKTQRHSKRTMSQMRVKEGHLKISMRAISSMMGGKSISDLMDSK